MIVDRPSAPGAADILEILNLAASYGEAISRKAVREAVQVYAPDGVLRSPTTPDAHGHDAIVETIDAAVNGLEFVFNVVHTGLVQVRGDRADARFPITEWARRAKDGRGILFLGVYEDELARTDVGWRFTSRRLVPRTIGRPDFLDGKVHELVGLRPSW